MSKASLKQINEAIIENCDKEVKRRQLELAGIRTSTLARRYAVMVTFEGTDVESLLEHNPYKSFDKTTNRFLHHPANENIPVSAHYHVYPNNGKQEIYAVNDPEGTAHHKRNKGYEVPAKEADQLRAMGVNVPKDNILEGLPAGRDYDLLLEGHFQKE
jgi:hypothetical protein